MLQTQGRLSLPDTEKPCPRGLKSALQVSRKGVFYSAPDAEPHKTKFCFRFKRNFGRGWSFLFGSRKAASKQKMKCRLTPKFQDSPAQGILTPGREFLFRYFYNIQCYRRRADSVCQIQKNLVRAD